MNLAPLARPMAVYTGLWAFATVGVAYLATQSGLLMLLLAGAGVLLVVLGAATTGPVSAAGTGNAEAAEIGGTVEGMQLSPGSSDMPVRERLLFYGLGLLGWSLAVLGVLGSSLR